jgi:hypothetical protein
MLMSQLGGGFTVGRTVPLYLEGSTACSRHDRPVSSVLELSLSHYPCSQAGVLGFSHLASVGAGLEPDTSAHEVFVTRLRTVQYAVGNDASGVSPGLQ